MPRLASTLGSAPTPTTRTAQACGAFGLTVAFVPTPYSVEAIVEQFPEEIAGRRFLLIRAREANPALPEGLRAGEESRGEAGRSDLGDQGTVARGRSEVEGDTLSGTLRIGGKHVADHQLQS